MVLNGIPISEDQCIGDSLEYLNGAFQTLSANLLSLSATGGSLNVVDSANIDLTYQSSSKVLSAVVSVPGLSSGQMMTFNGTQWGGARPFPTWNSTPQTSATNNQIGSGWVNYRAALLDTIRNNDVIVGDRTTSVSGFDGAGSGAYAYIGAINLRDGRVFCHNHDITRAAIYDPATNSVTFTGNVIPAGYYGGVLMPDGRVFMFSGGLTTCYIYDVNAGTGFATPNSGSGHAGGVVLPDGRIFCAPYQATQAVIYDPSSNTFITAQANTPADSFTGAQAQYRATLMQDGRVFCAPYLSTSARIYNPATNKITTPSPTFDGQGNHWGSALLPNGKIVLADNSQIALYDPVNDSKTLTGISTAAWNKTQSKILLPNGNVFFASLDGPNSYVYDPTRNIAFVASGTYPNQLHSAVLMKNGKVFMPPSRYWSTPASASIYDPTNTYETVSLDMNFVASPFNNKY